MIVWLGPESLRVIQVTVRVTVTVYGPGSALAAGKRQSGLGPGSTIRYTTRWAY